MTPLPQLMRIRHGARGALALGVVVSIVANVLHANQNIISQAIAAWAPLALLITIELIARVPVRKGWLSFARLIATTTIAGIAAWVSYWHMVGVAVRYGEEPGAAHLIPLTVDGLVVVAWVCLVELAGRIRDAEATVATPVSAPSAIDEPRPAGPVRAVFLEPETVPDSAPAGTPTETPGADETPDQEGFQDARPKPQVEAVVRAIKASNPEWGYQKIAEAALTSKTYVGRILRTPRAVAEPSQPVTTGTNGHVLELAHVGHNEKES